MRERPKSLDGAGLFRAVSPITPHKRAWLRRFDSGRDRFREVAVTESAGASPLKAVAFPDYSRSIPRPTTALTNDPSESFPPSCFFVGSLSVWWRVGTLAAAAANPRGCRAWLPTNTSERPLAFRRPWRKALAAVRVLAGRCLGGSRRESHTPKWTGNGTQITYANPRSCGPIFLKYENKSDRLRAGFDG